MKKILVSCETHDDASWEGKEMFDMWFLGFVVLLSYDILFHFQLVRQTKEIAIWKKLYEDCKETLDTLRQKE